MPAASHELRGLGQGRTSERLLQRKRQTDSQDFVWVSQDTVLVHFTCQIQGVSRAGHSQYNSRRNHPLHGVLRFVPSVDLNATSGSPSTLRSTPTHRPIRRGGPVCAGSPQTRRETQALGGVDGHQADASSGFDDRIRLVAGAQRFEVAGQPANRGVARFSIGAPAREPSSRSRGLERRASRSFPRHRPTRA